MHERCQYTEYCEAHDSACMAYSKWLTNGKIKVNLRGKKLKGILNVELGHGNCGNKGGKDG